MAITEMNPATLLIGVAARNWWLILVRGLAAILFGIVCLVGPVIGLLTLVLVYGAYAIVDGIGAIFWGARSHWPLMVVVGTVSVLAGLIAFFWPGITAFVLLYLIAAWAIVRGVAEIGAALHLRHRITNEWSLIAGGAVSILLGVLIAVFPGAGVLSVMWLIGLFAILFGIAAVSLALRLRTLERTQQVKQEEPLVGAAREAHTPDERIR